MLPIEPVVLKCLFSRNFYSLSNRDITSYETTLYLRFLPVSLSMRCPEFYKRYVDDTLSITPDTETAEAFLSLWMRAISLSASPCNLANTVNFLSLEPRSGNAIWWSPGDKGVQKPTDTRSLLYYNSHVDVRYKKSLSTRQLGCGNCSTWNVIVLHRHSPDFSVPNCCNRPSIIL